VPSQVLWSQDGHAVLLRQETSYPHAETSTLRIELERPRRFALRVRVPGRCGGFSALLNAAPIDCARTQGDWASIEREWQPGDVVRLRRIVNTSPERHARHFRPLAGFPAHWPHWIYFDLDAQPLC
jgi:DUF1680 family protein